MALALVTASLVLHRPAHLAHAAAGLCIGCGFHVLPAAAPTSPLLGGRGSLQLGLQRCSLRTGQRVAQQPTRSGRLVCSMTDDPYEILGVKKDATAAQIKQAYRRLALRSHPDVNKAADAQETFARIAEAYALLSDPTKRKQYDARSSYGSSGFSSRGAGGYSPPRSEAASRTAAAERARRWREENPTPEELGDSFGALFSDFIGAVGKVVAGGDWISLLDELQLDAGQMDTILRSSDIEMLEDELESARFVQSALKSRIQRLGTEVKGAQVELDEWERNWRMRDLERPAKGGMGKAYGRQLEQDLSRRRSQLTDARRLLGEAERREVLLTQRIEVVRSGGGRSAGRASGGASSQPPQPKRLLSVEEELQRMKREMGK